MSDLSDRWCFLSCVWCLITSSQIFIRAVHILRRGLRRPKNFSSFSVQNSNIVINFEDPPLHPITLYMDGPLRKLLSCHHIWLVNLSAWQVSACQLVSLSSYASLGACNLVFVHPKWEIGRQVDISPLLGHQLTAEKKQKITSTCRTLVGNLN